MTRREEFESLRQAALKRFEGHNIVGLTIVVFLRHESFAEFLDEPIETRLYWIIDTKPYEQIAIRLTQIQPYISHRQMRKLDASLKAACVKWDRACVKWDRAWVEWYQAQADFNRIENVRSRAQVDRERARVDRDQVWVAWKRAYEPIFMAKHPDCPWDGKTLFPEEAR